MRMPQLLAGPLGGRAQRRLKFGETLLSIALQPNPLPGSMPSRACSPATAETGRLPICPELDPSLLGPMNPGPFVWTAHPGKILTALDARIERQIRPVYGL
jgi:hypothetical protein